MESPDTILDWPETSVIQFFSKQLGLPQYEAQIREHNISGDVLAILDAEALKELGIATIGQRLSILKAVYNLKLAQNIPIEPDHYVPPSEAQDAYEDVSLNKLNNQLKEQGDRLRSLEQDNKRLSDTLQACLEDLNGFRLQSRLGGGGDDSPVTRNTSFKWANFIKPSKSPTKPNEMVDSPQPSPMKAEHETTPPILSVPQPNANAHAPPPKPTRQESTDNLKSFKVSLDDPTEKVLPAALKKYKINNDDWRNYAMFICYGSTGNRIERCLSYDEKPLLLFQKLKDAKKNPVFMLKHIKDIRSPIAVAQQKHAARKANSVISAGDQAPSFQQQASTSGSAHRPPRVQIDGPGAATPGPGMFTGVAPHGGWPEDRPFEHNAPAAPAREMPAPSATGVSYAVAIYPYMAEQEDEFDVIVGDTFLILSRARGWWVVQRDPAGGGAVEPDTGKQGWVPAGCLLETNVPVASAIEEAARTRRTGGGEGEQGRTPILPLSIASTSFPGVALMDYQGKGDEELDLVKDESLRVFKRYNHWSYAVKEDSGDRGWVPSWYIGKVATNGPPMTPSTTHGPSMTNMTLDGDASNMTTQPSPMSSAFPATKPL